MRLNKARASKILTWRFILKSDMIISAYTCEVTQYDKEVTLPAVDRWDVMRSRPGRYDAVEKELKFALDCQVNTEVSVTFDSTPMSGTDNVLKNMLPGNDNIGVQMTFSDDTPIKFATKYPVIAYAKATEILKYNAYYFYKGGKVNPGAIKAITTFTFEYQ